MVRSKVKVTPATSSDQANPRPELEPPLTINLPFGTSQVIKSISLTAQVQSTVG